MIASEKKKKNSKADLDECSVLKPNRDMSYKDQVYFYRETIHRNTSTMCSIPKSASPEVVPAIREECCEAIQECYSFL